jgi:hypothetical protein
MCRVGPDTSPEIRKQIYKNILNKMKLRKM